MAAAMLNSNHEERTNAYEEDSAAESEPSKLAAKPERDAVSILVSTIVWDD